MKLLIIEGPDRVGKDTLINGLVSQSDNVVVRHFGSAKGETDFDKRNFQFQFFKKEFELASLREKFSMPDKKRYPRDIWIMNRAHLGEFVYGTMYRNTQPSSWVLQMEEHFMLNIDPSIYLLLLTSSSAEFLCKRDDGESFSSDVEQKTKELELFKEAYSKSGILNKKIINVNTDDGYLDKDTILNYTNQFLNF